MTDEEYRELLAALARRFLRPAALEHPQIGARFLVREVDRLLSLSRLVQAVRANPDNPALLAALAGILRDAHIGGVLEAMDESGVLEAIEEVPDIVFGELRRSVIPNEDLLLLQRAGIEDPEAEITIVIQYAKRHLSTPSANPTDKAREAASELERAARDLQRLAQAKQVAPEPPKKKRKIFNGIGKILAGTITGAGNLLLGAGTILAPNPATGYAVIGSSALAVASLCQGIGDLRGE